MDTPASRPSPLPPSTPGESLPPAPPAGSGWMFPARGRSRRARGTAWGQHRFPARLGTTRVCTGTALQLPGPTPRLPRHGPGFSWTDKNKRGRRGGRGRGGAGERKKISPRLSDVTDGVTRATRGLLATFLGRRSCGKSPARRGGQASVPALPAACPGAPLLTGTSGGRNCTKSPGGSRRASRCEPLSLRRTALRRRTADSGRR